VSPTAGLYVLGKIFCDRTLAGQFSRTKSLRVRINGPSVCAHAPAVASLRAVMLSPSHRAVTLNAKCAGCAATIRA
jgi:hypothetical protein